MRPVVSTAGGEDLFRRAAVGSNMRHVAEEPETTRTWLKTLPLPLGIRVFVVWNPTTGLSLPWENFVAYWDDFCYPSSDDLFAFPRARYGCSGVESWRGV